MLSFTSNKYEYGITFQESAQIHIVTMATRNQHALNNVQATPVATGSRLNANVMTGSSATTPCVVEVSNI